MKRAKLKITLTTPAGLELLSTEVDVTDVIRETGWSPANTSAMPEATFSWILEDYCGQHVLATDIFHDQDFI